tara:strand:- start:274 stop:669 length:396 start_codon:yes stop_codon:yes gene_type:complete
LDNNKEFNKLTASFKKEETLLRKKGINTWNKIKALTDRDVFELVEEGCGSIRNFRCLRCIATFICDLDLQQDEAALLMHSGIPSVKALANSYPEAIHTKVTRLETILGTSETPKTSFKKIILWINKAKEKA